MSTGPRTRSKAHSQLPRGCVRVTPALLKSWPLPSLDGAHGKEDRGRVLIVGGSARNPGGALLAGVAALRAGAGKLQIATARSVAVALAVSVPEALVVPLREGNKGELAKGAQRSIRGELDRCDALVLGPGTMDGGAAGELVRHCLHGDSQATLVIDGAALDVFRGRKPLPAKHEPGLVLTPHAGEMARLWGIEREAVLESAPALALEAARTLHAVIALKGPRTFIASPDGRLFCSEAGNMGLGTSGSGDVLAGAIGGLCARGADPLQATVWGVYAHARAGDTLARAVAPLGFLARELLGHLPAVLHRLR